MVEEIMDASKGDAMMTDFQVAEAGSPFPAEKKESPSPSANDTDNGNDLPACSGPVEVINVKTNKCLQPKRGQDPVESPCLQPSEDSLDCPDVSVPELPKAGKCPAESDSFTSLPEVEVDNNAGSCVLEAYTEKVVPRDSIISVEGPAPVKAGDGRGQEFKGEPVEMKLDTNAATMVDELHNGVTAEELLPDSEVNEVEPNNVNEVELPPHSEMKAKILSNGATGMEFPAHIATEKEELGNVAIGMGLALGDKVKKGSSRTVPGMELLANSEMKYESTEPQRDEGNAVEIKTLNKSFLLEANSVDVDESGTVEEQAEFMMELETFHKERCQEFKPPKFYGEPLNCLKLWRAIIRLGGYEQVTSCKLWRQVGESFKPPKTCTTVSWTFRCFYEKTLLEYEKHKMLCGELPFADGPFIVPTCAGNQVGVHQASGSGRARRDAAARAMQGWHSQRLLGNGEVGDPIIKDKNSTSLARSERQLKSIGLLKRKKASPIERSVKVARLKASKPQFDAMVVDIGPPADWVKVNVQRTKDCFELYALVPGLLREEVRVQSDPAGRLVISGQPEQLDNPWGVTPFKKVVSLPSRIDPHQTSAVVTLHGQLFVRVPFEQSNL